MLNVHEVVRGGFGVPAAAMLSLTLFLAASCGRPVPDQQEQLRYRRACKPVIEWLETQSADTGRYPPSLPRHLQDTLKGFAVSAEYSPYRDGSDFEIRIGDYSRDSWEYQYSAANKRWTLDH